MGALSYLVAYIGAVALLLVHIVPADRLIARFRRRTHPRATTYDQFRSAVTAFEGTLRVHLAGTPPARFRQLVIDAAERGCELVVSSSLDDENFLQKLLSLGATIRVSVAAKSESHLASLHLAEQQTLGWHPDEPGDTLVVIDDPEEVALMVSEFDRSFATRTLYRGEALATFHEQRVETVMQRIDNDPAASARLERMIRPMRLSAWALLTFGVLSVALTLVRLVQEGSGPWLLPYVAITLIGGQLLGVLYQNRLQSMRREMMQLQSEILSNPGR